VAEGAAAAERPSGDTRRVVYVRPWRIDVTIRPRTPRLLPVAHLARVIAAALEACRAPSPGSVGLVLTDDRELASLNERHMGERGATDVLSFPMLPGEAFRRRTRHATAGDVFPLPPGARQPIGDIVVSVERAIDQAKHGRGGQTGDVRWSPADELRLLVTHGALHLCGWDHAEPREEAEMRALENALLRDRVP
jgi:probable rRNA maturation factor